MAGGGRGVAEGAGAWRCAANLVEVEDEVELAHVAEIPVEHLRAGGSHSAESSGHAVALRAAATRARVRAGWLGQWPRGLAGRLRGAPPQNGESSRARSARCRPRLHKLRSTRTHTCARTAEHASSATAGQCGRVCAAKTESNTRRRARLAGASASGPARPGQTVRAPFVDDLLVLVLQEVALLLLPRQHHSANLAHRPRPLLGRHRRVPLGQPYLALPADQQDEMDPHAQLAAASSSGRAQQALKLAGEAGV